MENNGTKRYRWSRNLLMALSENILFPGKGAWKNLLTRISELLCTSNCYVLHIFPVSELTMLIIVIFSPFHIGERCKYLWPREWTLVDCRIVANYLIFCKRIICISLPCDLLWPPFRRICFPVLDVDLASWLWSIKSKSKWHMPCLRGSFKIQYIVWPLLFSICQENDICQMRTASSPVSWNVWDLWSRAGLADM